VCKTWRENSNCKRKDDRFIGKDISLSRARNEAGLYVKPGGNIQIVKAKTTDLLGRL
jgi:hypothetical protein